MRVVAGLQEAAEPGFLEAEEREIIFRDEGGIRHSQMVGLEIDAKGLPCREQTKGSRFVAIGEKILKRGAGGGRRTSSVHGEERENLNEGVAIFLDYRTQGHRVEKSEDAG